MRIRKKLNQLALIHRILHCSSLAREKVFFILFNWKEKYFPGPEKKFKVLQKKKKRMEWCVFCVNCSTRCCCTHVVVAIFCFLKKDGGLRSSLWKMPDLPETDSTEDDPS